MGNLVKELEKHHMRKLLRQARIIGFRMVLCHKKTIYDWYAATDDHLDKYPNDDGIPISTILIEE